MYTTSSVLLCIGTQLSKDYDKETQESVGMF